MTKAGVNKSTIMKITGHKIFDMFLRYTHLDKEHDEDAMEKLNEFSSRKMEKLNRMLMHKRKLFRIPSTSYILPETKKG